MIGPPVPGVAAADVPATAHLLDVREDNEWAAGHAPGARHLPLGQLPDRLAEIPRDAQVVVVCRSGARSARAAAFLLQQGWRRVLNLDGGMQRWAATGQPMISENGQPARVL